jgi:DNA-directed RNA polymerase specialized sigma24 family protein
MSVPAMPADESRIIALLAAARQGSRQAFDELCGTWWRPFQAKIAELRHAEDSAEELEREALNRAWNGFHESPFAGWRTFPVFLLSYAEDQPMQRLISRAREGDQDAFARVWTRYRVCVRNALVFRFELVSEQDAEDLQSITWLKTWSALKDYLPTKPFKHFLLTVAKNEKLGWLQARHRLPELRSLTPPGEEEDKPSSPDIPVAAAETALTPVLDEMLRIALSDTKHPHRSLAFVLVRYLGISPEQVIAEYSATALDRLAAHLEQRLAAVFTPFLGSEKAFAPLRQALRTADPDRSLGETTLAEYFTGNGRQNLAQWVEAEFRRVWSEVRQSESVLLRIIFDGPEPPHECLTYACARLLRWTMEFLWRTFAELALLALAGRLESSYAEVSPLAPKQLRAAMRRLWENLDSSVSAVVSDRALRARLQPHWQRRAGELALADYAGGDAAALAGWYGKAERRIAGELRGHPHARACACFCGPEADRLRKLLKRCAGKRRV